MKKEEKKVKVYKVALVGKRYEQLERLSKNKKSFLLTIVTALDLMEKAKNH